MEEVKLSPELRFSEFEGEWSVNSLGSISQKVSYGMNAAATDFDGVNKYLRITDIDEASRAFIPSPLSSPDAVIEDKFVLKIGDIVFARTGASVGKSYLYKESDGRLLFAGFLIKFSIKKAVPYFVYLHTLRDSYKKWVIAYSMRSGQPGLNAEEYKSLKLTLPSFSEQQKIATFLTAVDERIQLLQEKKTKLEAYKKGVMQKLFSQEIRFKDENGNPFPEWNNEKLSEIIIRISTGLNPRKNFKLGKGKNFYVTIKNITKGKIDFSSCELIDDEALSLISKRSDLSKDDIIMSSIGNIGESYLLTEHPVNWNINESVFMIRPNQQKVIPIFLYYILTSQLAYRYFEGNMTGSSFKSIKIGDLRIMPCLVPSLKEQQKIAAFLSSIDESIEAVSKEIEGTTTFKKGLLQKMFV